MKNIDFVFLHPPRNLEYLPLNVKKRSSYIMMPMGLFSMADLLDREGYSTRILNYPLEKYLNPDFSLAKYLKEATPKLIGIDLHWVLHSAGSLDVLKIVKKILPNSFTLLGGYTATYYAKEIMKNYEFIDGIIKGDAEKPLVQLVKNLNSLESIPNLIYRNDGKIYNNPITFVANEIDSLNFTRLHFLHHWNEYINYLYDIMHTPWPLEIARGCPFNCVNCGGSHITNKQYTHRKKVIFRSPSRVVEDIKRIVELSDIRGIFYGHGVYPGIEQYFMDIHELIRKENLDVHADLELWRIPVTEKFIYDFSRTYDLKKSMLWFSVRSFSQSYREKFHRLYGRIDNSFNFSNAQLERLIRLMNQYRIPLRLFWDVGNPKETGIDLLKSFLYALKLFIKNISPHTSTSFWSEPIIISPGCPIEMNSHHFGINLKNKTFKDYLTENRSSKMVIPPMDVKVNYNTEYLSSFGINLMNKVNTLLNLLSVITN
jgi:radical SAM superfamily enzyme YgiQ (UPF0313 family)